MPSTDTTLAHSMGSGRRRDPGLDARTAGRLCDVVIECAGAQWPLDVIDAHERDDAITMAGMRTTVVERRLDPFQLLTHEFLTTTAYASSQSGSPAGPRRTRYRMPAASSRLVG